MAIRISEVLTGGMDVAIFGTRFLFFRTIGYAAFAIYLANAIAHHSAAECLTLGGRKQMLPTINYGSTAGTRGPTVADRPAAVSRCARMDARKRTFAAFGRLTVIGYGTMEQHMRLEAKLNGTTRYVAQISGAGFLNAHLNLSDRPKENAVTSVLRVVGYDTNSPTETVSVKWPEISLAQGDVVQLRLLEDGPADPPAVRKSTSDSPLNLFSDKKLAKELLSLVEEFEQRIFSLMKKAEHIESADEHEKFRRAFGHAIIDLSEHLRLPVYRRHPELVPEEMRGELL